MLQLQPPFHAGADVTLPTVQGAVQFRGRPRRLTLEQRMEVRRRAAACKGARGSKRRLFKSLALDFGVSLATIERTVYG